MNTTPYWISGGLSKFPSVTRDLEFDVVVVGAGMAGVTAAYQLKRAGMKVALVERDQCLRGETAHTTAHLSAVTDYSFVELSKRFGVNHAQAVWDAGFAAINEIDETIRREQIDCDFAWTDGYVHTPFAGETERQVSDLREEAQAASSAGFDAEFMESIPGLLRPGVRFAHQAKFHPLKYLQGVLACVPGDGSCVFERTEVKEVKDGEKLSIAAGQHTLTAGYVVIATHVPLLGKGGMFKATVLQTDLFQYNTYAIRARIKPGLLPEAMFWDLSDPYHYLRVDGDEREAFVIFGGGDHKTGQADERARYEELERTLLTILPGAEPTHRWSGQVIETRDGLPYIGEPSPRQFAATGFSGNGMTFGTLSGMMARDAATGAKNPWQELFDINRTRIAKGLWDYVAENKDYPYYLVRDRFAGVEGKSSRAVKRGDGKVLELSGEKVAVSRDSRGALHRVSAVCTHMQCLVSWNSAESTWDCPCHGSRFTPDGKVIAGPAESPLPPFKPHA